MMSLSRLPLALVIVLSAASPVAADAPWKQSTTVWKAMDKCARDAQKKYPDYTREANAKREAYRQSCLRNSNLPGEEAAPPAAPQR